VEEHQRFPRLQDFCHPTAALEYVQPPRKRRLVHITEAQMLILAGHLPPSISHWAGLRVGEVVGLHQDPLRLSEHGLFVSRVMLNNGDIQDFPLVPARRSWP